MSYILDWQEHNSIRADRKVNSIYIDLLKSSIPNIKLVEPKTRSDLKNKQTNKLTTNGQQMDNQWTVQQNLDGPRTTNGQSMDSRG